MLEQLTNVTEKFLLNIQPHLVNLKQKIVHGCGAFTINRGAIVLGLKLVII